MIIEYKTGYYTNKHENNKTVLETKKIQIKNLRKVFLQGTKRYVPINTYFGLWTNKYNMLTLVVINSGHIFHTTFAKSNKLVKKFIKEFLKINRFTKVISKEEFKKEIDHVRSILEI